MRIKGVGNAIAKQLLAHCGSAEEIFRTPKKQLLAIPGMRQRIADQIIERRVMQEVAQELSFIEKHKIKVLFWGEVDYPAKLKHCLDAPVLLFYRGHADLNTSRIISVVGTRHATDYGKRICDELIRDLGGHDLLVVSGLAYGIDSYAHQACIKYGLPTVGVLGHGLDRIYPVAHRHLATTMLQNGGLLTEYESGTNPDRQNFPSRNRIIAGLADVTIVVEAAPKGGALITAEIANTYNRDVCAFPGDIYKESSNGCNYLIKTHRAHLIQSARDLAYVMGWDLEPVKLVETQLAMPVDLKEAEAILYRLVHEHGPLHIDELAHRAQRQASQLAITLLELEMRGLLAQLPGKVYRVV